MSGVGVASPGVTEFDTELELSLPELPEMLFEVSVLELIIDDISDEIELADVDELENESDNDFESGYDETDISDSFEVCPVMSGFLLHELTINESRINTAVKQHITLLFNVKALRVVITLQSLFSILFLNLIISNTLHSLVKIFFKYSSP